MGILWPDQWTISTIDGGRSAQFEHTVSAFINDPLSYAYPPIPYRSLSQKMA